MGLQSWDCCAPPLFKEMLAFVQMSFVWTTKFYLPAQLMLAPLHCGNEAKLFVKLQSHFTMIVCVNAIFMFDGVPVTEQTSNSKQQTSCHNS